MLIKAKDPESITLISHSLENTKREFGSKTDFDWTKTFYQYANRLAHVKFLRDHYITAYLVNIYFVNDAEMKGPVTIEEWKGALRLLRRCLGLRENTLRKPVVEIFIDVGRLRET